MKRITIGRSQDNDMTIGDKSVSRHHSTIVKTANVFVICNNNSSNVTFINGKSIEGEATVQKKMTY